MINPKSCNNGFRSAPSDGGGICLIKGFDVNMQNSRNPKLIIPAKINVQATNLAGKLELKTANETIQRANIIIHNNKDPS